MLKNTLNSMTQLDQDKLKQSETDTDFTLNEYHKERISFHMSMLNYYLNEEANESMATRDRIISGGTDRN